MNRPYYVSLPRNIFGEHLQACPTVIRNANHSHLSPGGRPDIVTFCVNKPLKEIEAVCKDMNDLHEAEMMRMLI